MTLLDWEDWEDWEDAFIDRGFASSQHVFGIGKIGKKLGRFLPVPLETRKASPQMDWPFSFLGAVARVGNSRQ